MSEFNDGGLAERGGGGLASPGGPNTAGGGGGQANRSGMGLGVNSGAGWANNPYSNNRNPGGVMAGGLPGNFSGFGTVRRDPITGVPVNPVTGQPVRVNPVTGEPLPGAIDYYNPLSWDNSYAGIGWPNATWGNYDSGYADGVTPGGVYNVGGLVNGAFGSAPSTDFNDQHGVGYGGAGEYNTGGIGARSLAATSGFAADPNAPSGIMTMMGGRPGQGMPGRMPGPMRPPGPMVNPGPIRPGGQPSADPRSAQLLAFHQAMRDWKGQRPQDRNDMAAWETWRNSRPDRPDFGRPRPRMSRPPRIAEQRPAPRPRGFQIGGDLALRHMYNR